MTDTSGQWTPKTAALRDLILLMIHLQGGIVDGTGRVASRIREFYTIPDTKTNNTCISEVLGLMAQERLIIRRMDEGRTRTYGVELAAQLSEADVLRLEEAREGNLTMFIGRKTDGGEISLTQLTRLCQDGYRELQAAATRAPRRDTSGRVAINATGVLKAVGISGENAQRIRYYLKQLGLICSHNQCNDTDAQLWWWTISTNPIDTAKLHGMASGENSFESSRERRRRSRTGEPEAGPVTVRRIGDDQAAPTATAVEVTTRRTAPKPTPPPPAAAAQASGDDTVGKLLGIIARLEGRVEELTGQAEATEKSHRKALEEKDGTIADLQRQLATRQQVDGRAADVIARYGGK